MSAATTSNTRTIYIPLLDEGVAVSRPTQGVPLPDNVFLVLPTVDYDPDNETWAFVPGSKVICVQEGQAGHEILVARDLAPLRVAVGQS